MLEWLKRLFKKKSKTKSDIIRKVAKENKIPVEKVKLDKTEPKSMDELKQMMDEIENGDK